MTLLLLLLPGKGRVFRIRATKPPSLLRASGHGRRCQEEEEDQDDNAAVGKTGPWPWHCAVCARRHDGLACQEEDSKRGVCIKWMG